MLKIIPSDKTTGGVAKRRYMDLIMGDMMVVDVRGMHALTGKVEDRKVAMATQNGIGRNLKRRSK